MTDGLRSAARLYKRLDGPRTVRRSTRPLRMRARLSAAGRGGFPDIVLAQLTGRAKPPRMADRSILISGCSSGIGHDAAHALKARGWRVFAACRHEADCARLRDEGFEAPRLDYTDEASIAAALDQVLEATGGTLDALFNNGAHAIPGALEDLPTGALRAIFEANVFGWHTLARRVIPVMRAQGKGRIVNHSSVLGFVTLPWRGAYNATKFATEALTDTLRIEMRDTPIHVITLNTGPVTSRIRHNSIPHFETWVDWRSSARREQYEKFLLKRLYQDRGPDRFELPPSAVSKKLIHALEAERPRARYRITTPTYMMDAARRLLSTRALDRLLARG
jgi:NAD(P)-dependent dehydrogenase (short-subunit alcohol dehydrogenase family)